MENVKVCKEKEAELEKLQEELKRLKGLLWDETDFAETISVYVDSAIGIMDEVVAYFGNQEQTDVEILSNFGKNRAKATASYLLLCNIKHETDAVIKNNRDEFVEENE